LNDSRVVGASQRSQPLEQPFGHHPEQTRRSQRRRYAKSQRSRQRLPACDPRNLPILMIASKSFIASIPRERDRHMSTYEPANCVSSEKRRVGKRLARVQEKVGYIVPVPSNAIHFERLMIAPDMPCHRHCCPRFVVLLLCKPHIECLKPTVQHLLGSNAD